ncbi:MAG: HD domain-containing protein [Candidatus Omnitrophica bacterium]|jgi:HD-GYP domain-containing protein (c-di-GMP phosphodiesterase class II)|nr:HD domain-containing protein [Candidatus Omnitrophota bacterium]
MDRHKKPDYSHDLEKAARQMILVRRLDTLVKLIIRTITINLKVEHAGLLLYDKAREEYVAKSSRGKGGMKIPEGLVKVKKNNPLVRYFTDKSIKVLNRDYLLSKDLNKLLKTSNKKLKSFYETIKFQLSLYNAQACIPGFFREELVCILFLGQKNNHKSLTSDDIGFLSVLSSDVVMAIKNAWFFEDLKEQLQKNRKLFLQTIMALATAIEAKDRYTLGHTERVSRYSLILAKELKKTKSSLFRNWDSFLEDLKTAAFLHDIGKIGVPESVLNKNGPLDSNERKSIEKHPLIGFSILKQVDEFQEPILGVKYHHEYYDGSGYPEGLRGENIPLIAQIICVTDAFDAMTTDRPYRKGLSKEQALNIIKENRGRQFSPLIADTFIAVCHKGKIEL